MSEGSTESKIENKISGDEPGETSQKQKRGSKTSKSLSNLAKEAEAILKGFGEKEDIPEGRRATRSSTRGPAVNLISTPPPVKKERKSVPTVTSDTNSATRSTKRGRPKKSTHENAKTDDHSLDNDNAETNDISVDHHNNEKVDEPKSDIKNIDVAKLEENRKSETEIDEIKQTSLTTNGSTDNENNDGRNVESATATSISQKSTEKSENTLDSDAIRNSTKSFDSVVGEKLSTVDSTVSTNSSNQEAASTDKTSDD